jgi:outer membrane receptor protein involved in Fe transport
MKKYLNNLLILFFLFCSCSIYADAKSNPYLDLSLEELLKVKVFIASGTALPVSHVPSVVTVITSEDIKNTGATNLTDILKSVPGIHINANAFGFRPLIHMRGTNSFQTLLMVNGTPMRDLVWAFGIFWKGLPVSIIDRVEIIRGPGSAIYGADASAGVINVITKTAGTIKTTEVGVRTASFNTQTAWMQSGGNWDGVDIGITADFSKTDGHDPFIIADGQSVRNPDFSTAPDNAHYGWQNADIRFSLHKNNWHLLSNYMRHNNLETGMTGAGNLDPVTNASDERYDIDLLYNNKTLTKNWGVDAKIHYQDLNYSSNNGFQEAPANSNYPNGVINHMSSSERQFSFELIGLYSAIDKHRIRVGVGYYWKDLYRVEQQINSGIGHDGIPLAAGSPVIDISDTAYAFAPEKNRKNQFLFVQDEWTLSDHWDLTMGARYDNYSDFGDAFNPRLALIWQTTEILTSKLLYGQSFRAPSFQELYVDTSRAKSNPDLDPDQSETIELSFSFAATNNLQLDLTFFNLTMRNFISRELGDGESLPQYQNAGTHKIPGVEIEVDWQAQKNLLFSANYSYRKPDSNKFRVNTEPKQQAYFRSDWGFFPGWNWNVQANWIADRIRSSNDVRMAVDDYAITDTTIRYTGLKNWEFTASIRNLFDEDAREATGASIPNDFPLPERNIFAQVMYKF